MVDIRKHARIAALKLRIPQVFLEEAVNVIVETILVVMEEEKKEKRWWNR